MAGDVWSTMPFDQAVQVNPTVRLERGSVYAFVDMQAVDPGSRSVGPSELREFKGGGSRFMNGDTLMARITPCLENGKIARYAASKAEEVGHGSTEFIVIRGRPNVTDNGFAYYLTKWDGVRQYCISQMTGSSGRQRVPTSALSHREVTIPPLKEQEAIACILGALDDKIELNRTMNRTLEAMATAIFKSWFVDFDPVRAKCRSGPPCPPPKGQAQRPAPTQWPQHILDLFPDRLVDSEVGEIPKGWRVRELNTIARLKKRSVFPRRQPEHLWEHYSIPAFDGGAVPASERGGTIKSGKYAVPSTCVLVSKLNPQFPRVWLPDVHNGDAAICSTEFLPFVPERPQWRSFLYELIRADTVQQGIQERITGSTGSRQRAKPNEVAVIQIVHPGDPAIEQFGAIVGPMHEKILMSIRESRTLAALRDALLPKLISGELRVPDAERIAGRCV